MGAINTFMNALVGEQSFVPFPLTHERVRSPRSVTAQINRASNTVERLLNSIQPVPPNALLLGECRDGLPLLIELGNPEMGAILVSCEKGGGKTHQLQVMAESAARLNAPSNLQLGILTFKPDEWQTWQTVPKLRRYLQGIYAWYDPWAGKLIQTLADLAEARQQGQRLGTDVLLILDDLNFIEELIYEAQVNLHWLLEYGSQSGIWVVGAINAHHAANFRYWVDPFRTRIIGQVFSEENADVLAIHPGSGPGGLPTSEFCAWTGVEWRSYRLPLLGD